MIDRTEKTDWNMADWKMMDVSDIDKLSGPHESVLLSCASSDNLNDVHSSNPRTQTTDEIKSHEQFADQVTPGTV